MLDLTNRKPLEELEKLPKPTNEGLKNLFAGVDKIIIKDSGVYKGKAMSDKVVLTLASSEKIRALLQSLIIDENNTGFYCMCLGTYAIELHTGKTIRATIGLHHGTSIRYDDWNGDAELAKSDELLMFLAEQGMTKPWEERLEEKRNKEPALLAERKFLQNAPYCFRKYIDSFDEDFQSLIDDLNSEIPGRQEQIIQLLQTFGCSENLWSDYPS